MNKLDYEFEQFKQRQRAITINPKDAYEAGFVKGVDIALDFLADAKKGIWSKIDAWSTMEDERRLYGKENKKET